MSSKKSDMSPEKQKYLEWYALPSKLRVPLRQEQIALELGVTSRTLRRWQDEPEFIAARDALLRSRLSNRLPDVLEGLTNKATAGEAQQSKMFLELLNWYTEKSQNDTTLTIKVQYADPDPDAA